MTCSRCGSDNPAGKKFCGDCGSPLANRCPQCGADGPAGKKFCGDCGTALQQPQNTPPVALSTPRHLAAKILESRSTLEGERKQVTVLFADVKGSMQLAAQLDPEDWTAIMQRFFAILSEGVERYEGFVDKFTGDGIMALFGAPIAHEDHAQRACFAARHLETALRDYADQLRRTRGLDLSTRIGINSGEVVVGTIGDDLRMEYTAQGHTVGLAQRMEQCAAPGSTCLTAYTAKRVEGYFQLEDLGDMEVKGAGAPLRVYRLQGEGTLRTRLDASRSRGFSKFVGRDRELATLESALEGAVAGNGQVVGVVAEAGTGKSRLCLEFIERCRARGIRVNTAHCPAHGKTVPYLPLLEILRDIFGIQPLDDDPTARRKIADELARLDPSFEPLLPILYEFMGVGDPDHPAPAISPEGRQQQLMAFVHDLTRALGAREPTVLFCDDLHWVDPGSDDFLAHAVEAAALGHTLWLVNFRPEYQAAWMGKSFYQQIPLRPMGGEEVVALLADLLGTDPSVAGLPARIHERTGGNPFFVEEIVQALVERACLEGTKGAYRLTTPPDALTLPDTVQSVLAARLDRLPDREKRLLQTASVIGKEFPDSLLREVVASSTRHTIPDAELADSLGTLAHAEFIHEHALYPEVEYAFKHPLTQEVAYHSQLAVRRAELHGAVARTIEQRDADKLDERAALLAYHWEQAGKPLTAAGWYARAADAEGLDSPAESLRHWEQVRALLKPLPSSEEAVALRLRAASALLLFAFRQGMPTERVEEIFAEGSELARARGDVHEQVRLYYGVGLHYLNQGDLQRVVSFCEESLALADATTDPHARRGARELFEFALPCVGELGRALRMNDEVLAIGKADPAAGTTIVGFSTANAYAHRNWILTDLGRFDEAIAAARRADELARQFGENEIMSWGHGINARLHERRGDAVAAVAAGRRAVESAERVGSLIARAYAHGSHGMALNLAGEWDAARTSVDHALDLVRTHRVALFTAADFVPALAEAHAGLGNARRAKEVANEAIEISLRATMPIAEVRAQLTLARVVRTFDRFGGEAAIEAALDRADALVQSTGARSFEPQVQVERAHLAILRSDTPNSARRRLQEAQRLFTEMSAPERAAAVTALIEQSLG